MKAKLVCFKLSKTMCILGMIVIFEIGFILVQVNELQEYKSFKQMQENVNKIEPIKEETTNLKTNTIETNPETNIQKQEIIRQEYQTMPETLKAYKVIRKNNHTKTKLRYLYFRRNHNKIPKSISHKTIWTKH